VPDRRIRIGAVGCGGFGLFALEHFTQVPGVELFGVADTDPGKASEVAGRFSVGAFRDAASLVEQPDVDLIYIATPPFLHYPHSMLALQAGKHVICEKPLALSLQEADEMMDKARQGGLLLVCNLMQRYNPLFEAVRRVVADGVLGQPLHGYFENYAKDEPLPAGHWFWDRVKSGGIFVEHAVHFFDLFEGWLGPGKVEAAQRAIRPDTSIEEHVQCTVRYGQTVLVNFYHGFHQPARLDRQETRLVFERGDVTLEGWIPTAARIRAIADEKDTRRLCELFPGAALKTVEAYNGAHRLCTGRHKRLDVCQMMELAYDLGQTKEQCYGYLLRAMLKDQVAWLRDPEHERLITAENGRQSLATALEADRLARQAS